MGHNPAGVGGFLAFPNGGQDGDLLTNVLQYGVIRQATHCVKSQFFVGHGDTLTGHSLSDKAPANAASFLREGWGYRFLLGMSFDLAKIESHS